MTEPNMAWLATLSSLTPTPIPLQTNEHKRGWTNTHKQVQSSITEWVQTNSRTNANGHKHADEGAQTSANKQVVGTSTNEHGWAHVQRAGIRTKPSGYKWMTGQANKLEQAGSKGRSGVSGGSSKQGKFSSMQHCKNKCSSSDSRNGCSRAGVGASGTMGAGVEASAATGWHLQQEQEYYLLPSSFFSFFFFL